MFIEFVFLRFASQKESPSEFFNKNFEKKTKNIVLALLFTIWIFILRSIHIIRKIFSETVLDLHLDFTY